MKEIVKNAVDPLVNTLRNLVVDHNLTNYDIWRETGRSKVEQQEFKDGLIKYCIRGGIIDRKKVKCMMTNEWHPRDLVIAEQNWKSKYFRHIDHPIQRKRFETSTTRSCVIQRNSFPFAAC